MEHFPSNDICDRTKLSEACQAEFELNEYLCDQIWRLPLDRARIHQSIALARSGGKLVYPSRFCSHPPFFFLSIIPQATMHLLLLPLTTLRAIREKSKGKSKNIYYDGYFSAELIQLISFKQRVIKWHRPLQGINWH